LSGNNVLIEKANVMGVAAGNVTNPSRWAGNAGTRSPGEGRDDILLD
jgi:V8-like Glu-specific endopeptidase